MPPDPQPVLLHAHEVQAALASRMTQFRRLVFPPPSPDESVTWLTNIVGRPPSFALTKPLTSDVRELSCPYGQPGDRLWVRETWLELDRDHWGDQTLPRDALYAHPLPRVNACAYRADTNPRGEGEQVRRAYGYRWRPSIHMPRWASRLTLEVVEVRVQRLQEISEQDARASGAYEAVPDSERGTDAWARWTRRVDPKAKHATHRGAFAYAWDTTNGRRACWASNPWVWAVTFKPVPVEVTHAA